MILTLEETKEWLRVDGNDEDLQINMLLKASERYLKEATGIDYESTNELAKLFCLVLVVDWYENREFVSKTSENTRHTIGSILMQLSYGSGSV